MKITDKFSLYAMKKAYLAVSVFTIWAVFVAFKMAIHPYSASIWLFYLLLLLNTLFSIMTFATITPQNHFGQKVWDAMLALCIVVSPLTFNSPLHFVLMMLILFVVATLKYIFLIPVVNFSKLLFYKIRVDTLGILMCVLCLFGILSGFVNISLDLWTIIFFIANIYVLWHEPLYKTEHHFSNLQK